MQIGQFLRRAVATAPHRVATIFQQREQTYAQFATRIRQMSGALRAMGIANGERVAVLALNSDRYAELYYAIARAGGILVPLNTRLAAQELIYMLNDAAVRVLFIDDATAIHLPAFDNRLKTVQQIIYMGEASAPQNLLHYENLLTNAPEITPSQRGDNDIFGIFYTGGTTGLPKGVMLSHDNYISVTMETLLMRRATWGKQLTATPFFHVSGSLFNFVTVAALTSHCILPKFSPHDYLQAIQEMHPNASMLVPSMVNALLNYPDVAEYELSSMLMVMVGGAVLSPATLERAGQLFLNCDFVNTYGMTETAGGVTFMYPDLPAIEKTKRPASIGLPVHTGEIQIVNAAGETLAPGETGEIVIRAKNVMQGYWQQPEKTAEALRGGWLHSGDTGYMDEDGFLFVVDRLKDMIITGGENVYPAEVENVLFTHPAIANCAVIGLPDEQWGERVHAVIIPGDGMKIDTATIIAHCRQFIAGYKCPRSVDIRTDALPMSGAGKVLKHILRDEYEQVSPQPPEPPPY